MNNENYISEETFEELVNGLDFIGSFTLYGRKSLKYHIKRLQEENQQLKQQLEQRDNIINKTREYIKTHQRKDEFLDLNEWQTRDLLEILNIDEGEMKDE